MITNRNVEEQQGAVLDIMWLELMAASGSFAVLTNLQRLKLCKCIQEICDEFYS